jgi:hypothetical protein
LAAGVQEPVHAPPTHAELLHATGDPHWPFDPHDSTLLPEQVVCVGAQTPVQTPLTHVWPLHAAAVPQAPVVSHV